jgi:hypothetical protein
MRISQNIFKYLKKRKHSEKLGLNLRKIIYLAAPACQRGGRVWNRKVWLGMKSSV